MLEIVLFLAILAVILWGNKLQFNLYIFDRPFREPRIYLGWEAGLLRNGEPPNFQQKTFYLPTFVLSFDRVDGQNKRFAVTAGFGRWMGMWNFR